MGENLMFCNACGKEIAKSAKVCPHCGKRYKKPFWQKLIVVLVIIGVLTIVARIYNNGNISNGNTSTSKKLSVPKDEYITLCQTYTYDEIARNPDTYKGKPSRFTGKVKQVIESGKNITLRISIGEYYLTDIIWVDYIKSNENETRILDDDMVTVFGDLNGLKSYKATLGNTITIPWLKAYYIERQMIKN